ncbi:MAG: phosphoserine transaminase [Actinomycetota bacterium]|nr:phosphoserine transaminase [Actinomycetota bacterium]
MSTSGSNTASNPADLRLPSDLLPSDGRFGSGPSKVRQEAVLALVAAAPTYLGTSHRQSTVKSRVEAVGAGLRLLYSLPDGYEVVLGNGGAAAFWDLATFSLIDRRSQHLSFGQFSSSFAAGVAAAPHLEDPEIIESPLGSLPQPRANDDVDVYALTHNETSTGVAMEIRRPAGAADDALVVVDGTSAVAGLRVDPAEFDVYYFSPQKGLGSEGGLWLALCSPRALERVERLAAGGRAIPRFLSLAIAVENSRANQTYNTPSLSTLFLLANQVEWILENGGLEWSAGRCDESAAALYGWAEASAYATPFVSDPAARSHVVGTIDLDESIDAKAVTKVLRNNGIVDTEPYRNLGRNQLRIAMFPNVEPADVAILTEAVDYIVKALA